MIRTPIALIPYVFLAAFVLAGILWHQGDQRLQAASGETDATETPVSIGGPFALTDQDGNTRTEKDLQGRFSLVFFGFTYCPDVCPTTLAIIQAALEKLGSDADRVVPVFITVDPERDTPAVIKSYLSAFGTRFIGLTGTPEAVTQATKAYRVYAQKSPTDDGGYSMDHSSIIYLMGPDGKYVAHYQIETGPDGLAQDLRKRIAGAS